MKKNESIPDIVDPSSEELNRNDAVNGARKAADGSVDATKGLVKIGHGVYEVGEGVFRVIGGGLGFTIATVKGIEKHIEETIDRFKSDKAA